MTTKIYHFSQRGAKVPRKGCNILYYHQTRNSVALGPMRHIATALQLVDCPELWSRLHISEFYLVYMGLRTY